MDKKRKTPKKHQKRKQKRERKKKKRIQSSPKINDLLSRVEPELWKILSRSSVLDEFVQSILDFSPPGEGEEENFVKLKSFVYMKNSFLKNWKIFREHKVSRDGKFPLCRTKNDDRSAKFIVKYSSNVLSCQTEKYFDKEKDEREKKEYYEGVKFDYEGLNKLLFSTYCHGDRRVGLWAWIDRQEDGTLRCAYNGSLVETSDCLRQGKADEEHLVPQSWHRGSKTHPGCDMHQIFIVSKSANGSRGNRVFGIIADTNPTKKVGGEVYKSKNTGEVRFCPYNNVGAVCRSTLYTLLAYTDTFHAKYFPKSAMKWIIDKAMSEVVTLWEKHRNQQLYKIQHNRNPFIDFPDLAAKIDFSNSFVKKK